MTAPNAYFTKVYRGWTIKQTDQGWIILNQPNWIRSGPVPEGPFCTDGIARKIVDRIMDDAPERYATGQSDAHKPKPWETDHIRGINTFDLDDGTLFGTVLGWIRSIIMIFMAIVIIYGVGEHLYSMIYRAFL